MQLFTDPERATVLLQVASLFVSFFGFLILIIQIKQTAKRIRQDAVLSVWATLRAERQRIEADVTQIDIHKQRFDGRRAQLAAGASKLSSLSDELEKLYPEIFRDNFKGRNVVVDNSITKSDAKEP